MILLLNAVYGSTDKGIVNHEIITSILSGSMKVSQAGIIGALPLCQSIEAAKELFAFGHMVANVFQVTLIGFLVGQAISVSMNVAFIVLLGEITYNHLKKSFPNTE